MSLWKVNIFLDFPQNVTDWIEEGIQCHLSCSLCTEDSNFIIYFQYNDNDFLTGSSMYSKIICLIISRYLWYRGLRLFNSFHSSASKEKATTPNFYHDIRQDENDSSYTRIFCGVCSAHPPQKISDNHSFCSILFNVCVRLTLSVHKDGLNKTVNFSVWMERPVHGSTGFWEMPIHSFREFRDCTKNHEIRNLCFCCQTNSFYCCESSILIRDLYFSSCLIRENDWNYHWRN